VLQGTASAVSVKWAGWLNAVLRDFDDFQRYRPGPTPVLFRNAAAKLFSWRGAAHEDAFPLQSGYPLTPGGNPLNTEKNFIPYCHESFAKPLLFRISLLQPMLHCYTQLTNRKLKHNIMAWCFILCKEYDYDLHDKRMNEFLCTFQRKHIIANS
jgi:hypothetical protein